MQRADVLKQAWRQVAANDGAAGVDGVTIESLTSDPKREGAWLDSLREELRTKSYRSSPVKRVTIPKASGGRRPLGIPTVKDRVVQMAAYMVLMPIFEADFHPCSFGFRPSRRAHQAIEEISKAMREGRSEVVDADISQYFDTIPHRELLKQVARRVSDGMILKLIKGWLRAPIKERESGSGSLKVNRMGTPQGGVISPLLANIYLHPLDEAVNEQCERKPRMIRYADDLVILCRRGEGEEMKRRLSLWLQHRGLELNEGKTRVVKSWEEGFNFLGFTLRWQRSNKTGRLYVHTEPSARAEQALRDRVRELTCRGTTWQATSTVVRQINAAVRGWGNYFEKSHGYRCFVQMNPFVAHRLRQWLWCKHGKPVAKYKRWPHGKLVRKYGLYQIPRHTGWFARTDKGTRKAGCGKTACPV
ncbi:MAG: group II intron reverse transcriptase/maturase [Chthoniobacteraceae bacterium]